MNFRNIIFDLGGVFIQIDYNKTENAFVQLGIENFAEYYKQDFVSELFETLEVGKIEPSMFYDELRKLTATTFSNQQIENAWNAMLGSFWLDRIEWLNIINKKYKVFLFSNTNAIHYNYFMEMYNNLQFKNSFDSYFIKPYYSHILGLRKPNVDSYQYILNEQNLIAEETLFIDDTYKNIQGAANAGMQTLHLTSDMNLIDCFK